MGVFKKLRSIGLLMPIVQKSTISWRPIMGVSWTS